MRQSTSLGSIALAVMLFACNVPGQDATKNANDTTSPSAVDPNGAGDVPHGDTLFGGPAITCDPTVDGTMINAAPGTRVAIFGSVNGAGAITSVTVNGAPATLSGSAFSADVTTRFGVNFADVSATDARGVQSTRTCAFVVGDRWVPEGKPLADAVTLELAPGAIDDGNRAGVNSFGDILSAVASSPGLRDGLNAAVTAAPVKPLGCDLPVCTPFGCIGCTYSSGVYARAVSLPGPQNVSLAVVDGGLVATVHVPSVGVALDVMGAVGPVPYGLGGWVALSDLTVTMRLNTYVANGKLGASVVDGSVGVGVGTVSTVVPGLVGWILDHVVVPLAQGPLRNFVAGQIAGMVSSSIAPTVGGLLSGLDLSAIGGGFPIPSLTNPGATIPLSTTFGLSSLTTSPAGMRIGLSSAFSAPATHARPSLGIAIPQGAVVDEALLAAPTTMGAGLHVGVFNQALHALWRGGMFDATITGGGFGGGLAPADASIRVATRLPPVANFVDDVVELSLGGLGLEVTYPGLFGAGGPIPALEADLGARVTVKPKVEGSALRFEDFTLSDLHVSTGSIALGASETRAVNAILKLLVQQLVMRSMNSAFPAMPLPAFHLPPDLKNFGLSGTLGLGQASMSSNATHIRFGGQMEAR